jgi:hypothetical protein
MGKLARNAPTIFSLLLFAATSALWLRSYHRRDIVCFGRAGGNSHLVQSLLGRVHLLTNLSGGYTGGFSHQADRISPRALWNGGMSSYPHPAEWHHGFIWQTYDSHHFGMGQPYAMTNRLIVVPYAFPAAIFALAPLAWLGNRPRDRDRGTYQKVRTCPPESSV